MSADRIDQPVARQDYLEAVRHYREVYLRVEEPVVVAYAFEGRKPGYWRYRVEDGRV